jgi:hypothetical protein
LGRPAASGARSPGGGFDRYMQSAHNLSRSIRRNRADADFAEVEGHEIVYVFDANVFIFHADLTDTKQLTRDLQHLLGDQEESALGKAIERLTAGFLFSGQLPGQRQPSFISLPHFAEVLGRLEHLGREFVRGGSSAAAMGEHERARIIAILADVELDPAAKMEALGQVVPQAVMSTLDASAHYVRTLKTAFLEGEGRLVPLDRREWGRSAAAAAEQELREWTVVLSTLAQQSRAHSRTEESIHDDARTLQTLVNLYRADAGCERSGKVKYVLITADDSLAAAVARRAADLNAEGIPDFIRSPRDYIPLLNLTAMSKAMGRRDVSREMKRAFEGVFDTLGSALDWVTPVGGAPRARSQSADPIPSLRRAWQTASRYATVLNAGRFAEGAEEVFAHLRQFVESEGAMAAGLVESSLIEVRDRHVSLLVEGALADLIAARRQPGASQHRRVVLQLITDAFGDLVPIRMSISDLLDDAIARGTLPKATMDSLASNPSCFEAQLLACAMLVAAERWGPAAQFGTRAVELAETSSHNRRLAETESAYLLALCLRYSMTGVVQFKRAHELLMGNLRRYASRTDGSKLSQLRRLRDEMELGTLALQAAVNQELSRMPASQALSGSGRFLLLEDKLSALWFREGAKRLREARVSLQESIPLDHNPRVPEPRHASELLSWISSFSATNLLGAYVYERIVPGLQSGRPAIEDPSDELAELEDAVTGAVASGGEARPILSTYYWAARALLARTPDDRRDAISSLDKILHHRAQTAQSPVGDRLETNYLSAWTATETRPGHDTR